MRRQRSYLIHKPYTRGVCFKCRKSYSGIVDTSLVKKNETSVCPDCRGKLTLITRCIGIPKKTNKKRWKEIESFYN